MDYEITYKPKDCKDRRDVALPIVGHPVRKFKHLHLPQWLKQAVRKATGIKTNKSDRDLFGSLYSQYVDHYGSGTYGGYKCWVTQPYRMSAEFMNRVNDVCIQCGFEWVLRPASHHYPGETFSLIIWKEEK